eukprot:CAMPEP_0184706856 /NCGR_PEP_ID=MMETSP0313-20130426/36972_1 /TAXON_ID=2792 /ORGANISM="Porphyridium aerugineum, Strain SAG 1380-2" /LENGTH=377 /DNA_ID=CAMNT_0027168423 /DNA_START=1067 /DNA_END=2200 /DNA_ORIENTATION=+
MTDYENTAGSPPAYDDNYQDGGADQAPPQDAVPTGDQPAAVPHEPGQVDASGGYYDENGNYHDGMGGIYDPDGNYFYDENFNKDQNEAKEAAVADDEAEYTEKEQGFCKRCMTSVVPLMSIIIALNIIVMIMGSAVLGVGIWILMGGDVQLSGFSDIEGVVTSSPYVFSIICIVLGAIIIVDAMLGCFLAKFMATGGMFGFIRCIYFVYQSFMILTCLILIAVCILSGVGLGLTRGGDGYNSQGWINSVQSQPEFLCMQEYKFTCAGYFAGNCDADKGGPNRTIYCPGWYCMEICKVTQGGDQRDLCNNCMNSANDGFDFLQCQLFEMQQAATGCAPYVNQQLEDLYTDIVIVTCLGAFFTILCIVASAWKSCSCCQ